MNADIKAAEALPDHNLYTNADRDRPKEICDRNGEVVLSQCKVCGRAEVELSGPCSGPSEKLHLLIDEFALEARIYDEEGYTLDPDLAVTFDRIKQLVATLSPQLKEQE